MLSALGVLVISMALADEAPRDLQRGQRYEGGTLVRDAKRGLVFRLPESWAGRIPHDSEALLLNAPQQEGVGIVVILGQITPEQLEERLSEPQDFGGSVLLQLARPLDQDGVRWKAAYLSGNVIGRALAMLGPAQQAVVYFFAGPRAEAQAYEQLLDELRNSTRFDSAATL